MTLVTAPPVDTSTAPVPVSATPPDKHRHADFRPDIEGLRAVAVTIVVLFHGGLTVLAGGYIGVDVFFVISGFLITSQLLREITNTGRISIGRFYARRVLRLLPASSFVVAATLAAAWLWLPPLRVTAIANDALTTTMYGLNYRLAIEGTDYLGSTAEPSPLQHFWSLAVEEQFYLIWPLLLLLAARTRRGTAVRRTRIAVVLAVIIAVSFTLSVWQTRVSAPWAYFGAHTRAWELAAGALIAIAAPLLTRLPRRAAVIGRWTGLAGIAAAALLFTEQTAFPGYAAALPVLAACTVIATGCANATSRILGAAPLQAIGRLSYGWYLWHWPILIIGPHVFGPLTVPKTLALAGLALLLAIATSRRVEDPMRQHRTLRRRTRPALLVGAGLSAGVAGLSLLLPVVVPSTAGSGQADDTMSLVSGSAAEQQLATLIQHSSTVTTVPANLSPSITNASTDVGRIYTDGCDPAFADATVKKPCMYGDPNGTQTIVLLGDSHAGHWFPAVNEIATERHWRLAMVTKSACSAASATIFMKNLKRVYTECDRWRTAALEYINTLHPAMVIASSNGHGDAMNVGDDQDTGWAKAWTTTFDALPRSARLVLISDTAWPSSNIPECVSNHLTNVTACNRPRTAAFTDSRRRKLVADAATQHGGTVIDPAPWMCEQKTCPVIIGNILVYKDDSHISATFSTMLAPLLSPKLPAI
ncbi:acyltransferase family protein [Dactylosporangium matsuzakiense]|uniref:Acyltransferase n=1 Tax=Dactylosporangium matsuzakiense TaxID=53360 RepID=A0A9W6NPY6_9ACTN|nr:acyltransferase family protein [Dactylosporangium matsuzakiense]UWZ44683.1 acyltransferase [Dactylosporangium matsuzakiense]GLL04706.1 acyltransferase [Dactylosporangium matsuzakiense]